MNVKCDDEQNAIGYLMSLKSPPVQFDHFK